jgi:hypothetical protein
LFRSALLLVQITVGSSAEAPRDGFDAFGAQIFALNQITNVSRVHKTDLFLFHVVALSTGVMGASAAVMAEAKRVMSINELVVACAKGTKVRIGWRGGGRETKKGFPLNVVSV